LWLIPASAKGWLGITPDPLSAVFAILLALPWSILLSTVGDFGAPFFAIAVGIISFGQSTADQAVLCRQIDKRQNRS